MLDNAPTEWKRKTFESIARLQPGFAFKSLNFTEYSDIGLPLIRIRDLAKQSPEKYIDEEVPKDFVVNNGDILVGMDGEFNCVVWMGGAAALNQRVLRVFNQQGTSKNWLHYLLQPVLAKLEAQISGTTVKHLSTKHLKNLIIATPPLAEQQRIAEILTSVDDSIRATEAVIEQAELVKRGLMEELLTGGLGSAAIARGEVPEGWSVQQVGGLAAVKGGKRMPKGVPFSEKPTPYPYIRVTDFKEGSISKDDLKFVSKEHQAQIARYTIGKDDIYISIAGTLGVVGLVPEDLDGAQLTENAAKIVLKDDCEISKEYLALVLQSEVGQSQVHVKKGVGGGVPKLALFRIAEINVPVPPAQEQDRISRVIGSIDQLLRENSNALEQTMRLKRGLMDDLLSGRVRTV